MRIVTILLPLVLLACGTTPEADTTTPAAPPAPPDLSLLTSTLPGLLGEWVDEQGEGTVFHEQWHRNDDNSLTGLGFVMSGNDTVFIEDLGIRWNDREAIYSARIPTQNQGAFIEFKLTIATRDSLIFKNPDHDFPQRIVYAMQTDGTWKVRVSGMQNEVAREEHFHFRPRGTAPPQAVQ